MGTITALEVQKRNKERVNIYLDGEYAFSLALMEAAKLRKGQMLTEAEISALQGLDQIDRAVDTAARFLAYRPRSVAEVRRNLAQKNVPEDVIEMAVERLTGMGYLDDTAFARYWLENRNMFKPLGPKALRYELRQKGVDTSVIESVMEDVDVQEAAYRAAQDKARRMQGIDRQTFRHKLGSFLQRRGFTYGVSRDVIEQLMNEIIAENPDFFLDEEEHD